MIVQVFENAALLSRTAAQEAAEILRKAIRERRQARIIAATGNSQIAFLAELCKSPHVDWKRVEMFHLDEYIGLPITHPASFRKYLMERLILPTGIEKYHLLDGEGDVNQLMRHTGDALRAAPIDIAFVGVGENGHLAFNDPPANFETSEPYIVVQLDDACRQQQVNEGWYAALSDVPQRAISMSVRQILQAKQIFAVVPESRKAQAIALCLEGEISPMAPASILRTHPATTLFLDRDSAALLSPQTLAAHADTGL
jgi:glucosamine-6-phosphate deaminase